MLRRVIAVDTRMANASGIGTYIRGLLYALRETTLENEEIHSISPSAGIYSLSEQWAVPKACRRISADLLHSPHYNVPISMVRRSVVTVHDLIHLKFPEFLSSPLAKAYAHFFFKVVIPKVPAILTVSERTKFDLVEMLKIPLHKITVAYPGVPPQFEPQSPDTIHKTLTTFRIPKDYFLFVGNLKEFKNVQMLVKVYKTLAQKLTDCPPLVMVGRNFIPGFDRQLESTSSIHWLKEVKPETLPSLYAGALGFVFPSLYEGFGFPPLEAMACGTPVICSKSASLPEVVGDAALLIDPHEPDSLLEAMLQLQQSAALRKDLRARGLQRAAQFSWKTMAEKTLSVYRQCLN